MKFAKKVFACTLGLLPMAAEAQIMNYEKGSGEVRSLSGADYQTDRELYLDGDLSNLPSDLSHTKWARDLLPFFKSMDADGDSVLSEYDLRDIELAEAKTWGRRELEEVFSFWRPDVESHLARVESTMSDRAGDDYYLSVAAKDVQSGLETTLDKLGFLNRDMGAVYVSATAGEDVRKIKEGLVTDKGRKWVELRVPFQLSVAREEAVETYHMYAHLIAMRAFPRFEGDDRYALWQISVSWDEE